MTKFGEFGVGVTRLTKIPFNDGLFTSESRGDAMLGDLHKPLGRVGHRPALFCVAVKGKLNGIAVNRLALLERRSMGVELFENV